MSEDDDKHISLAAPVFYLLLGAAVTGGAGVSNLVGGQAQREAIEACFDNSKTAISVAAQHGEELVDIRGLLLERTRYRYTSQDAESDKRAQEKRDEIQNRRLDHLEREMDRHEHKD